MRSDGFVEATKRDGSKMYFPARHIMIYGHPTGKGASICFDGEDYAVEESVTELLAQLDVVYCAECGRKMEAKGHE